MVDPIIIMAEDICMVDIIEADIIIITDEDTDLDIIIIMDTDIITAADIEHSQVDMDIIRIETNTIIVIDTIRIRDTIRTTDMVETVTTVKAIAITREITTQEIEDLAITDHTTEADHAQSQEDTDKV